MDQNSVLKKVLQKGPRGIARYLVKKITGQGDKKKDELQVEKVYNILLLTNRDSDNVGDQVIEACDIGLITTVMKNLGVPENGFKITSRAASIISQKYLSTRSPELLQTADKLIKETDIVIFGGAPLFNYLYQNFYERTSVTLEIAQKYNKPVVFSAIGVEQYDEDNAKCQRLKTALNLECVKQITTRDGYELLKQYKENENLVIGKVSDPAVFSCEIFEKFVQKRETEEEIIKDEDAIENSKIGIFILRANGFVDNKFNFPREDAASLWKELIYTLKEKGYDYELLTSGHFGDEAFLDYLIKNEGVDPKKCVFNVNTPEILINKISSYKAIVSCRLHPSIISYSLGVPSIGIVWNSKVKRFYESIGYGERLVEVKEIKASILVEKIEKAIKQGVVREEEYLKTVYESLFTGIRDALCFEPKILPYDYNQLLDSLWRYGGTSDKEKNEKIRRKFRRTYSKYNELFDKKIANQREINELRARYEGITIIYNSGISSDILQWNYDESKGEIQCLPIGSVEYKLFEKEKNSSKIQLIKNEFVYGSYQFLGWRMRVKDIYNKWFWCLKDGTYGYELDYVQESDLNFYLIKDEGIIPSIPIRDIVTIVLEGVWDTVC